MDENVYDIFEQRNGLLEKILRPNLTVEHLLTMKSGVQFNEMGVVSGNDWVDSFLNAPVKGTPGEAFEYNSMNTYLLSAIIQERTGIAARRTAVFVREDDRLGDNGACARLGRARDGLHGDGGCCAAAGRNTAPAMR